VNAVRLAEHYLENRHNRGIFERASDFADRASQDAVAAGDPVRYLLDGHFVADATRELRDGLAETYRRYAGAPVTSILDAGCGPGASSLALARLFPDAQVVGIDVEEPALRLAEHLAREEPRCRFEHQGLEDYSPGRSFDLIQCRAVLEHVFDPRRGLERVLDLLGPGGIAYVETPNYLFPWEPHLLMPIVPKSPKRLVALQCRLTGRDPGFVDHLNFECDPLTLKRWAHATATPVEVVDLMAIKAREIFEGGTRDPVVGSRAGAVRALRRVPGAARLAAWAFSRLPIAPSVLLLFKRPVA
jgi:SAM-dependent methyltransferase